MEEEIAKYKIKLNERIQKRTAQQPNLNPSKGLKLSAMGIDAKTLEGKYVNPIWGQFEVKLNGDNLHFQLGNLKNNGLLIAKNEFKVNFHFAVATASFIIEENSVKGLKVREIGAEFMKLK